VHAPARFRGLLTLLCESLLTTFVPSACSICSEPLTNSSRLPVCQLCRDAIGPISVKTCTVCGERVEETSSISTCGLCVRAKYPFDRAVAFTPFEGEARELIHLLKYSGVKTAAPLLGKMIADAIRKLDKDLESPKRVLVVPVPLHRQKSRSRGFNQSELVARAALRTLRDPRLTYAPRTLVRVRRTEPQAGLSNHQRRANLRGSFAVRYAERLKGDTVLLVDDVYTTGATAAECARTLKRAGAKAVYVATIARSFKFSAAELDRWHLNLPHPKQEEVAVHRSM